MDCIFCKIGKGEIQAMVIAESEDFLAFLDIHPHSPGHTLVISKDHANRLLELPTILGNELLKIIQQVINRLQAALKTTDFTLGINEGPLAGQAVAHLHLHVIPRFANDQGGSIHAVVYNKSKESVEEIYRRIKPEARNKF